MQDDTDGFSRYLLRVARITRRELPFYLKWVGDFQSLFPHGCKDRALGIEKFEAALSRQWQEWQVLQALSAVRHYWYYTDKQVAELHKKELQNCEQGNSAPDDTVNSLIEESQRVLRLANRSYRTERSYVGWLQRFLVYLEGKLERKLGIGDITADSIKSYLTYLAVEKRVAAATQQQAFNALLFFCRRVLDLSIDGLSDTIRARKAQRLPVVLSQEEVKQIIKTMPKPYQLMCMIIYGGGLRLSECLALRIRDLDFDEEMITIRSGKGNKDRTTLFPLSIHTEVREQIRETRILFDEDRRRSRPGVPLPHALVRKYPAAATEWGWYWLFPSPRLSIDPWTERTCRYHLYPSTLQKQVSRAVRSLGLVKHATVHSFRHSFATHLIEAGYDVRTVQELLGHQNLNTTMVYTHVAVKNRRGVISPMSRLYID